MSRYFYITLLLVALLSCRSQASVPCQANDAEGILSCIDVVTNREAASMDVADRLLLYSIIQSSSPPAYLADSQVQAMCRLAQSIVHCVADYMNTCFGRDVPNVQRLIKGVSELSKVCERPDFYQQAKVFMACGGHLIETNPAYRQCNAVGRESLPYMANEGNVTAAMAAIRSGAAVDDFCRVLRQTYSCQAKEFAVHCTPEQALLRQKVFQGIMDAFSCPAPPAPLTQQGSGSTALMAGLQVLLLALFSFAFFA